MSTLKSEEKTYVPVFDGRNKDKYEEWSIKVVSYGKTKGWGKILQTNHKIQDLEAKDKRTEDEEKLIKANAYAYDYLTMSTTGDAFSKVHEVKTMDALHTKHSRN